MLPVNDTALILSFSNINGPMSRAFLVMTTWKTSSGTPASSATILCPSAESGVWLAGRRITVQPAAKAGEMRLELEGRGQNNLLILPFL